MTKEKIAFVSMDRIVNKVMTQQLYEVFGETYEIKQLIAKENEILDVNDCVLAVFSNIFLKDLSKSKLTKDIPIIGAKRTIDMDKMSEIISIESGSRVLVVSNHKDAAYETIEILNKIGINHIQLIPYYPNCNEEISDIAITPGGMHLIPPEVKKTIDIGMKVIDISTIIEIFVKLKMPIEKLYLITEKYNKDFVRINKHNSDINKTLQGMFEILSEGIVSIDKRGKIIYCNKSFSRLIGLDYIDIISKNYVEIFKDMNIIDLISLKKNIYDEIVDYNDKKMLINKITLSKSGSIKGSVIGIQDITYIQSLENKVRKKLLNKGFVAKYTFNDVKGKSKIIKNRINIAKKISKSDFSVLIQGNNGTGKEIFAQAIHNESNRNKGPFIAVNLAALSDNLIESELFGYEEGSFTGALKGGKQGFFEMAHNGTIFIDEIGDTSLRVQQRLLRVLQEKEIMRIGGNRIIPINVRVIVATNRDLIKMVEKGLFRKDLYYRLRVLHVTLPDLKERTEDIPLLVDYFFKQLESNKYINQKALMLLEKYSWPGNIRELRNLVYYLESIAETEEISIEDLTEEFKNDKSSEYHTNEEFDLIIKELISKNILNECLEILKLIEIANNNNLIIGRNKIKSRLSEKGFNITVDQIRQRMERLKKYQFLVIGTIRKGSIVSEKGKEFIRYNHST